MNFPIVFDKERVLVLTNVRTALLGRSDVHKLVQVLCILDEIELVDAAHRTRQELENTPHIGAVGLQQAVAENVRKSRRRYKSTRAAVRMRDQVEIAVAERFVLTEFTAKADRVLSFAPAERVRIGVK